MTVSYQGTIEISEKDAKGIFQKGKHMAPEMIRQIKEYAKINYRLEDENEQITAEHPYMAVTNPWIDSSGRFDLDNAGAVKEWGLSTVIDFCEKAQKKMEEEELFTSLVSLYYDLNDDLFDDLKEYVRLDTEDRETLLSLIRKYSDKYEHTEKKAEILGGILELKDDNSISSMNEYYEALSGMIELLDEE